MLRELGEEEIDFTFPDGVTKKITRAQKLAVDMWADSETDKSVREQIFNRLEGKPKETLNVETQQPIRIMFDELSRGEGISATSAETVTTEQGEIPGVCGRGGIGQDVDRGIPGDPGGGEGAERGDSGPDVPDAKGCDGQDAAGDPGPLGA
jgi:hypothetical protein